LLKNTPLHSSGDFSYADLKLRSTFTVILPLLAIFKSMIYLHKNVQQSIGYLDPTLFLTEKYFTGPFYSLQAHKLLFKARFLTKYFLLGYQGLTVEFRASKTICPSSHVHADQQNKKSKIS
jgi:hypothetical protein